MTARRKRRQGPPPISLVAVWREQADILRQRGAELQAHVLEGCAREVEDWLASFAEQPLTLAEASRESGYSVAHLRRLISLQVIPNIGHDGDVRIARGALPRKPGRVPGPSLAAAVLGIVTPRADT